jgi:hypothetical protein
VIIDYINVVGLDCGGGVFATDPVQSSAGFLGRVQVKEWIPSVSVEQSGTEAKDVGRISSGGRTDIIFWLVIGLILIIFS